MDVYLRQDQDYRLRNTLSSCQSIIMLPAEFYLQNTTTLLLWLFQMCSHDLLLFLILLGVVVIVFSFSILGFNVSRIVFSVVLAVVNSVLRRIFRNYLHIDNISFPNPFPNFSSFSFRRLVSDSTTDSDSSARLNQQLPFSPYLALQPAQWAAIEAILAHTPSESDHAVFNSILDTTGQFTSAQRATSTAPSPLRRSARLRRPRNSHSF